MKKVSSLPDKLARCPPPHRNARGAYPEYPVRTPVADAVVPWTVPFEYVPVDYTHERILSQPPYADPVDPREIDWMKRRFSLECINRGLDWDVDAQGRPIHPIGRTGMSGRGRLGKWGPNFAADCLVTRRAKDGVFEFVAIERSDTGLWALPGGMVDDNESLETTAVREFFEEAASTMPANGALATAMHKEGQVCYTGLVDDSRSTDNAWTETLLLWFDWDAQRHPEVVLKAADDATNARWVRADGDLLVPGRFHSHHRLMILDALDLLKDLLREAIPQLLEGEERESFKRRLERELEAQ